MFASDLVWKRRSLSPAGAAVNDQGAVGRGVARFMLTFAVQSRAASMQEQFAHSRRMPFASRRTTARWLSVDVSACFRRPVRPRRTGSVWWKRNALASEKPHCEQQPPSNAIALAFVLAR